MSSTADSDSIEPVIDNLWYYQSVMNPQPDHPHPSVNNPWPGHTHPSLNSPAGSPESLPLSTGGQISPHTAFSDAYVTSWSNESVTSTGNHTTHSHTNSSDSCRITQAATMNGFYRAAESLDLETQGLHRIFDAVDENHDGEVDRDELSHWTKKLGLQMTEDGMIQIMKNADRNGDGCLNFLEFVALNKSIDEDSREGSNRNVNYTAAHKSVLKEVFELFDKDGNGLISPEELGATLTNLGVLKNGKLSDYVKMINSVDTDGDGQVSFFEFQTMMDERPVEFLRSGN